MTGTSGTVAGHGSLTPATSPVLSGLYADLQVFATDVGSSGHTEAVRALDGATRLIRTLESAEPDNGELHQVAHGVESIRAALQNGRVNGERRLAQAVETIASQPIAIASSPPPDVTPYVGATVLTVNGSVAGTIAGVGHGRVMIEPGGPRRVLGVVPLPRGPRRTAPIEELIFGARRRGADIYVIDRTTPTPDMRGT